MVSEFALRHDGMALSIAPIGPLMSHFSREVFGAACLYFAKVSSSLAESYYSQTGKVCSPALSDFGCFTPTTSSCVDFMIVNALKSLHKK